MASRYRRAMVPQSNGTAVPGDHSSTGLPSLNDTQRFAPDHGTVVPCKVNRLRKVVARRLGACQALRGPMVPNRIIRGGEFMDSTGTEPRPRGIVVGVGMQKGGVAKTTNALHLAAALGESGRRVLLWDVDENYGATKVFGLQGAAFPNTMSVLAGDCTAEEAVLAFDDEELDIVLPPGVDFIPSSRELTNVDKTLQRHDQFFIAHECMREHIAELQALGRYDYIFIDTGPHASTTTRGAYMVADYFILSVIPEKQAVHSIPDALADIVNARKPGRNPKLHLLGLVVSCMDRRKTLAKRYEMQIAEKFRDASHEQVKFKTTLGVAAAIDKAYSANATVLQTEPNHKVAQQYRDLAMEVEDRIAQHRLRTGAAEVTTLDAVSAATEVVANG